MQPLTSEQQAALMQEMQRGSYAYVRNLAAAEQAVQRGQFNVAKVLRAAGYAQRIIALNAARILEAASAAEPVALLTTNLAEQQPLVDAVPPPNPASSTDGATFLQHAPIVRARVADMLQRSLASLENHPDILERDVAIRMYGCLNCGNPMETQGDPPEQCDLCGSRLPEFEHFGPYYALTPERMGWLNRQQVLTILEQGPTHVAALIADADDDLLSRKPTPEEWSIKEIVAHILETDSLGIALVQAILTQKPFVRHLLPWQTHEGKGYENMSAAMLIAHMTAARAEFLALLHGLAPEDWSKRAFVSGRNSSVLDVGYYLANHDVGHLAQVRRMVAAGQPHPEV